MKKHANTLFIMTAGSYVSKQGETLLIRREKKTVLSIPIHTLEGVVCFGRIGMSPFALGLCGERGVSVAFMTEHGRLLSRMSGPQSGNILLRREQFRVAESPERAVRTAKCFVMAKMANARTALLRSMRDHSENLPEREIKRVSARLKHLLDFLWRSEEITIDELRGVEGDAARNYFSVFDHLILNQKSDFFFRERNRRPPRDRMNALLSFLYTLLANDVRTACEATGLDPQMGFLHTDRSGRPSLALDIMEELRPFLADRLALSLVNRRQVTATGFEVREAGGVIMKEKTRKTLLKAYQERKAETLRHPYLDESITLGLLPHIQTRLLARYLRGDIDLYPAFFWR